ncbi:uncharacterized protein TrAFT101_011860 [Trichoderma asperellum]|uniref:uncharacterized protein n=1 Tax=Trichoderma asperellum TaxID=101201 RepID=UPI0033222BAA|nr:hypothetical protein TrAFT101_011860 [Trichoderma asperellum]
MRQLPNPSPKANNKQDATDAAVIRSIFEVLLGTGWMAMIENSQAVDSSRAKPADAQAGAFIALRTMQARPCFAATMQRVSI